MRKLTVGILCLVCLIGAAVMGFANEQNLLKNSGFEELDSDNKIVAWRPINCEGSTDSEIKYKGDFSGKITLQTRQKRDGMWWQQIVGTIDGGTSYNIVAWVRREDPKSVIQFKVEWYDAEMNHVDELFSPLFRGRAGVWEKITWQVKAPAKAKNVNFMMRFPVGPGELWFDDVYFGK